MGLTIVHLQISCWQGISLGAEHYYGQLRLSDPYTVVDLKRVLTQRAATKLNKKDSVRVWNRGSKTERFDTQDEIIELAIKEYKNVFPNANILLLGNNASAEPQKVLDGPKEIMIKANKIFDEYDKIEWINRGGMFHRHLEDEQRVEDLSREFEMVFV